MSGQREDRVRGFPAFPPAKRRPRQFAQSWWGNAWLTALEETSLDPDRLTPGRRYAYHGQVGPITVSPGRIAAQVYGSRTTPYRTVVLVEQLTDAEWERFLDQAAATAGHIAALLDKDMPHDLVEAAADAGVPLLPGIGDLEPECSCPDWGYPCKHAAALCYQVSWLLDADPFVLLLMRGRGERELLDELQRRNLRLIETSAPPAGPETAAGKAGEAAGTSATGTPAEQAYALGVPPLPAPPPVPAVTSASGQLPGVTPAPGVDPDALRALVADAATRARELLASGEPPPVLDVWQDTVRLAATYPDGPLLVRLRQASGRPPAELARAVQAWRYGGMAGLAVLEAPWSPQKQDLARARAELAAGWEGDDLPDLQLWRNRWTVPGRGLQLRFGRDGRWYPYREEAGDWWPAGPPERDPAAALAQLLSG